MTEQAPKKGMSKGCLIAIIVAFVLIALFVLVAYLYYEDFAKWGTVQLVSSSKVMVAEHADKIDTTQFNAVVDKFIEKFNNEDIDMERFGAAFQNLQGIVADEKISEDEAKTFMQMMIDYYPDLAELAPTGGMIETGMMDSTMIDSMMLDDSTLTE